MAGALKQVLAYFEREAGTVSLPQMARELGVERAVLQDMIDYWVRKGRLRETASPDCGCGCSQGCPYVMSMPRQYELVRKDEVLVAPCPSCVHAASATKQ